MNTYFAKLGIVRHLLDQHSQLEAEVAHIHELLDQSSQDDNTVLQEKLCGLRAALALHFDEEEDGGCIEEAVSRCPSLAGTARSIDEEHSELLTELDDLIRKVTTLRSGRVKTTFNRFAVNLNAHERRETDLLSTGLNLAIDN